MMKTIPASLNLSGIFPQLAEYSSDACLSIFIARRECAAVVKA